MRVKMVSETLWIVFAISFLVWLLGLIFSGGGWIWIFFVIWIFILGANLGAMTGGKGGRSRILR